MDYICNACIRLLIVIQISKIYFRSVYFQNRDITTFRDFTFKRNILRCRRYQECSSSKFSHAFITNDKNYARFVLQCVMNVTIYCRNKNCEKFKNVTYNRYFTNLDTS